MRKNSAPSRSLTGQPATDGAAPVPVWELPNRADRTFQITISRNTLVAVCLSVLLHLLVLFLLNPRALLPTGTEGKPLPITVTLNAPVKQAEPAPAIETPPAPVNVFIERLSARSDARAANEDILAELEGGGPGDHDPSTATLIARLKG